MVNLVFDSIIYMIDWYDLNCQQHPERPYVGVLNNKPIKYAYICFTTNQNINAFPESVRSFKNAVANSMFF